MYVGKGRFTLKGSQDLSLLILWAMMYGYCLSALCSLGIMLVTPIYTVLAVILAVGTILFGSSKKKVKKCEEGGTV